MNIITIGYHTEGTTDERFLLSIIKRTFDLIAIDCDSQIEVYDPQIIHAKGEGFVDSILLAASKAADEGSLVLCVHADADNGSSRDTFQFKIDPAALAISNSELGICKILVPIVPIKMIEAWMLADLDLLKSEIGTLKSNHDLGLEHPAESYTDPKFVIEEAIRRAFSDRPKRHRSQTSIDDLYIPLGRKIKLESLDLLPSFKRFKEDVANAFVKLNYLRK